jgi:KaiC/GvpD/RAD55 family RecA-like ATPase
MPDITWIRTGFEDLDQILSGGTASRGIAAEQGQFLAVIAGPVGSCKSLLALQLCCQWLRPGRAEGGAPVGRAIYVGRESARSVRARAEEAFACFGVPVPINRAEGNYDEPGLYLSTLPPQKPEHQAFFEQIAGTLRDRRLPNTLVCFDDAGSIERNLFDPTGDLEPVRELFARTGASAYLVLEHDKENADLKSVVVSNAARSADVFVNLSVDTQSAYRRRYIEILKSRNQSCWRGQHGFFIVGRQTAGESADSSKFGMRIFFSVPAQLSKLAQLRQGAQRASAPRSAVKLGIFPEGQPENEFTVPQRTCTVLVSDLNTTPTRVAWEFARRAEKALYISFLHDDRELCEPRAAAPRAKDGIVFAYFAPEHVSDAKLVYDVDELIKQHAPDVVVLDNVSELGCKYPLLQNPLELVATLIELFRANNVTSFIVDAVEAGIGRDPIARSQVAGLGDNVLLLRSIEFQSRTHTVFSFQKHCSDEQSRGIWHLELENLNDDKLPRFSAKRTFEAYKNVLSGKPEPVTFSLGLFQDEPKSVLADYFEGMVRALKRTFGRNVQLDYYGSQEYAKVQSLILSSERSALADCHVMAIDEFWLTQLIQEDRLENISQFSRELERATLGEAFDAPRDVEADSTELGVANPFVTAACDIATLHKPDWPFEWYAVPFINNFGILCCDPLEVARRHHVDDKIQAWLERCHTTEKTLLWKDLVRLKADARHLPNARPLKFFGFCMDQVESAVSFLLELALSHGKPFRPDPSNDGNRRIDELRLDLHDASWRTALDIMLQLLDEDDLVRLASLQVRSASREPNALFSRQWVGSLASLRSLHPEPEQMAKLRAFELPSGEYGRRPITVSGTWYLCILKGSAALRAGVQLLEAFCNVDSDIAKWNLHLSAPVSQRFYAGAGDRKLPYGAFEVPYSQRFNELGTVQGKVREQLRKAERDGESAENLKKVRERGREEFRAGVLQKDTPFYRMRVRDYGRVSTVLWRMMGSAARHWLAVALRNEKRPDAIKLAIDAARLECEAMKIATTRRASSSG